MKPSKTLTPRERQAVALLCDYRQNKEIAKAMGISIDSAKTFIENARTRTGTLNRGELARWARNCGMDRP